MITRTLTLTALLVLLSNAANAQWFVDVEATVFKPEKNKVQIPNDNQGDKFNINDLSDETFATARITAGWLAAENHELQFVYAPLSYSETGSFTENIRFDGATFTANQELKVRYQFSSYRLRYLYHWIDNDNWQFDIGATLFVRDASIKLSQNGISSKDSNVGVVPLLALRTTYNVNDDWKLVLDTDFAAAPEGRAIDLALLAEYKLDNNWTLAGGYRTIEGGADNDDIYSFAWFNGVTLKASYHW